jgi:hypothetical protein
MRTLFGLILISLFISFNSCKKDDQPTAEEIKKSIYKNWITTPNNEYTAIEILDGNKYILIENTNEYSEKIYSGAITFSDDAKTLTLLGYGTVSIVSISSNELNFKIKRDNSSVTTSLLATPKAEISSSSKTKMLCRKWNLEKVVVRDFFGLQYTLTSPYLILGSDNKCPTDVTFSKYGTKLINEKENYSGRIWGWTDLEQTTIHSWPEYVSTYSGKIISTKYFKIDEITDTTLVLKYFGDNNSLDYRYYKIKN